MNKIPKTKCNDCVVESKLDICPFPTACPYSKNFNEDYINGD